MSMGRFLSFVNQVQSAKKKCINSRNPDSGSKPPWGHADSFCCTCKESCNCNHLFTVLVLCVCFKYFSLSLENHRQQNLLRWFLLVLWCIIFFFFFFFCKMMQKTTLTALVVSEMGIAYKRSRGCCTAKATQFLFK